MYDLKIINGRVVDFETGLEKYQDIGIKDGKIICIGVCSEQAKEVIDAADRLVSPGFIDIHMHEEVIGLSSDGDDYDIANRMLLMGVTTCVGGNCGNNRQRVEDFFDFIDSKGAPVNYLSFIGHNFLRNTVGISDRYRSASKKEINEMQKLAAYAIEKGALGISFGLEYSPGIDLNEIIGLCHCIDDRKALLSAHYRKDAKYGLESIRELIQVSKETGLPMQISHIGSCTAYGMMSEALEIIDQAIKAGIDIAADCYPYDAFCTFIGTAVFDEGCFELWNKSYDSVMLLEEPYKGLRCDEALFNKVRTEYPNMLTAAFVMNEEEVIAAIKSPFVMVASDGIYNRGQGHPRGAGTFPRVLGRYAQRMKRLSFVEALKKMTIMPAKRVGLTSKGEIKEGYDADLVIFRPEAIIDKADFDAAIAKPVGVDYVIINGSIAVKDNVILKSRLGRTIRQSELKRGEQVRD